MDTLIASSFSVLTKKAFPLLPKMFAVGRCVYYVHRYIVVYKIYECLIDLYLTSSRSQRMYRYITAMCIWIQKKKRKLTSNSPLTSNFGNNNNLITNFYNRTVTIDPSTTTQKRVTSKNGTKGDTLIDAAIPEIFVCRLCSGDKMFRRNLVTSISPCCASFLFPLLITESR